MLYVCAIHGRCVLYKNINIPNAMADAIDSFLERHPELALTGRADLAKAAIREYMAKHDKSTVAGLAADHDDL